MDGSALEIRGDHYFESTGPFRGHKQNCYEGGIRAPFIAKWPGHVKAGRVDAVSAVTIANTANVYCDQNGPMASNVVSGTNQLACHLLRNTPLKRGETLTQSFMLGVAPQVHRRLDGRPLAAAAPQSSL